VLEATTNVQALVTDVEMPGSLDGFTLARLVRQAWPYIGIVVTSGRVRPGPKDLPSGTLFLAKPYSLAALVDAVRTVLYPPRAGNASKTSVPMLPAGSNVSQPDTGIGISGGLAQPLPEAEE
jgi:two-component system, response regulator PdtaR